MNEFVILVIDDSFLNVKMAVKFLKTKQSFIINSVKKLKEYLNIDTVKIESYSGANAGKSAVERIGDLSMKIDLVITDLNMEDGYSGCTVIQELKKRDPIIPVYVTSNSLAEYYRENGSNSCQMLQESNNDVVNIYKSCCELKNVIGISTKTSGKLELDEIPQLFEKFNEYKNNLENDKIVKQVTPLTHLIQLNDNNDVSTPKSIEGVIEIRNKSSTLLKRQNDTRTGGKRKATLTNVKKNKRKYRKTFKRLRRKLYASDTRQKSY